MTPDFRILPVLPIVLPMATALGALLWRQPTARRRQFVAFMAFLQVLAALFIGSLTTTGDRFVLPMGGWDAQVGIALVIDHLSSIMLILAAVVQFGALLYGYAETRVPLEHPLRAPLLQFLAVGVNLSFVTGDLFNLFVAFEILLISSYALLTLEADNWEVKQAFPYVLINIVASALSLCAIGMTYGVYGTLNMAELSARMALSTMDGRLYVLAGFLTLVYGIKAGLFPLYFWLPNSYPTLPFPIAAVYAGLLTKVGIYALLRLLCTILPHDLSWLHSTVATASAITMLVAVLGALSRNFMRGILSFHILSQVGFIVLAAGLFTPVAVGASIFYIVHHIVVKSSLFLVAGIASLLLRTDDLSRMGGLWKKVPWIGALFLLQGLSLAGLPPLSGFWGKYLIIVSGVSLHRPWLVAASLLASVLTLLSMLKIWNGAFFAAEQPAQPIHLEDRRWRPMAMITGVFTVLSLWIGLGAESFLGEAMKAARIALDQAGYIAAVRGGGVL